MNRIIPLLNEMRTFELHLSDANKSISKANIGWHLEHSLLIIEASLSGLLKSNPKDYRSVFLWKRELFFLFGRIPKGRFESPKEFQVAESRDWHRIEKLLLSVAKLLHKIEPLPENSYVKHPFLGDFNKNTTLRFLQIHTKHHLRIAKKLL